MLAALHIFALVATLQTPGFGQVATPNAPPDALNPARREAALDRLRELSAQSQGRMAAGERIPERPQTLSNLASSPTSITEQSIRSLEAVRTHFAQNAAQASAMGFSSYLDIEPTTLRLEGCSSTASHPAGVQRISDGKLNGLVTLLECDGYWITTTVFDYSYDTRPTAAKSLPAHAHPIGGGMIAMSFGSTSDGKIRTGSSAIGRSISVDTIVESSKPIDPIVAESVMSRISEGILLTRGH